MRIFFFIVLVFMLSGCGNKSNSAPDLEMSKAGFSRKVRNAHTLLAKTLVKNQLEFLYCFGDNKDMSFNIFDSVFKDATEDVLRDLPP